MEDAFPGRGARRDIGIVGVRVNRPRESANQNGLTTTATTITTIRTVGTSLNNR